MSLPLHIIILAAGDGTRMKSDLPKVLHPVGGLSMLAHVFNTAARLDAAQVHIVYNPEHEALPGTLDHPDINWVAQHERLGTGHAVQQAMPELPEDCRVLVLYGDLPLLRPGSLEGLLGLPDTALGVLTMEMLQPRGYGRIIRGDDSTVSAIVEEKDASERQRAITEVNTGIIIAAATRLRAWLETLRNDNAQGEYYLTDVVAAARADGTVIEGVMAGEPGDFAGANDRAQLAQLEARLRQRRADELMQKGVRLADPARIEIRGAVEPGRDVFIDINVVLEGNVILGDGTTIGPGCVLRDCQLAPGTRVHAYSVLEGVRTHGACDIGPFARVRPGTELGAASRVGNFVEIKNTSLGEGSKASHLSYLGDSNIGRNVNIGAGTITCNYDGVNKHRTEIGDGVFIGSDTQLVAPVKIGDGANIGAGSTITKDAPKDKLTLSRSKQVTIDGWKRPRKVTRDK
ncbi:MAG: bifunctional UDP-N-acetylglucosamine diphosphorylase/glucosamine-1-phosphate N-acetyltransferase GlmU [Gammaproteobacteria bacterium]|nr:bifunctional UDP-N-acetylglucosamine diphosphorylase/glucosamine-1-phosphate N-acetyltransferase GlmU [Gammaproteobacteria bacterium]NNE05970.1 bifunctional UDP-N-acetylglucosamine diphosphorylase/glucosamine-1-phosphate N-acetyltransferase GlmU [Xanthomonadales bacterium]